MDASAPSDSTVRQLRRALSPSRAGDFQTCPLLYRLRSIDRRPEPPSAVAARGTVVHAVLEELFDVEPEQRTLDRAVELVPGAWERVLADDPRLADLFTAEQAAEQAAWLSSCTGLLESYFELEDPSRLQPRARELRVDHVTESGLGLGGIIDRVDVAPDGRVRIVDYKTGKAPDPRFEEKALFQMKFYALVVWRTRGMVPTLLQLLYLTNRTVLSYEPTEQDLLVTERKVQALWDAIARCVETGEFAPRKGPLCSWCNHQDVCPEFGGTPPPLPIVELIAPTRSSEET